MQKNKFVHEDIKAVCSSAAKKLVALGLAGIVNGGSIVNAQTKEPDHTLQITEKKVTSRRYLTAEELKEVIAKGKGEYKTWKKWCKANNVSYYHRELFELDMQQWEEEAPSSEERRKLRESMEWTWRKERSREGYIVQQQMMETDKKQKETANRLKKDAEEMLALMKAEVKKKLLRKLLRCVLAMSMTPISQFGMKS